MKEAFTAQQEAQALIEPVYAMDKNDREAQSRVANQARRTARLAFEIGESARALDQLEKARDHGIELLRHDPENVTWQDSLALTGADLAAAALLTGDLKKAANELTRPELARALSKPGKSGAWTNRLQAQLAARAVATRLSVAAGNTQQSLTLAETSARELAALGDAPPPEALVFLGETEIILGDVMDKAGNTDAASHWRKAERLDDRALGLRAAYAAMQASCRLGNREVAAGPAQRLKAAGYVRPLSAAVADRCGTN